MKTLPSTITRAGFAAAVLVGGSAQAGEIPFFTWSSGIASVALEPVPTLLTANNDDVVGNSPNQVIVYQKDYTAIGPVDLIFTVIPSGGTTEYLVTEGVFNNTGIDWDGYHIELGFGSGAGFVKSIPGDGLDFDAPDENSTANFNPGGAFFPTVTRPTEDDLVAGGGLQPDFTYAGNFVFHVDVPDGISTFTIRQSPLPVPEPGSAVALMLFGSVLLRRRR